jgi:hypothetical protein
MKGVRLRTCSEGWEERVERADRWETERREMGKERWEMGEER